MDLTQERMVPVSHSIILFYFRPGSNLHILASAFIKSGENLKEIIREVTILTIVEAFPQWVCDSLTLYPTNEKSLIQFSILLKFVSLLVSNISWLQHTSDVWQAGLQKTSEYYNQQHLTSHLRRWLGVFLSSLDRKGWQDKNFRMPFFWLLFTWFLRESILCCVWSSVFILPLHWPERRTLYWLQTLEASLEVWREAGSCSWRCSWRCWWGPLGPGRWLYCCSQRRCCWEFGDISAAVKIKSFGNICRINCAIYCI